MGVVEVGVRRVGMVAMLVGLLWEEGRRREGGSWALGGGDGRSDPGCLFSCFSSISSSSLSAFSSLFLVPSPSCSSSLPLSPKYISSSESESGSK